LNYQILMGAKLLLWGGLLFYSLLQIAY
jgi:hypothetical protein